MLHQFLLTIFFSLFFLPLHAMERAPDGTSSVLPVIVGHRTVNDQEAAAGLVSGQRMPIPYRYVFNMCNCLLIKESCMRDFTVELDDHEMGWGYYHQFGHRFSEKLLETMFAYGMLNFYIQKTLGLDIDLNVDSDVKKKINEILVVNTFTTKVSLCSLTKLSGMTKEEKGEALWQAMQRYKFLLGDHPQKMPTEILKAGVLYQRYKIVLEKCSTLMEYSEVAKLVGMLDILQRSIIDFVNKNKDVMYSFLKDVTKRIEYKDGLISDHKIIWHEEVVPPDVLELLRIPELMAPFPEVEGDQFKDEVRRRLGYFEIAAGH